jgi:hypothetical protein
MVRVTNHVEFALGALTVWAGLTSRHLEERNHEPERS